MSDRHYANMKRRPFGVGSRLGLILALTLTALVFLTLGHIDSSAGSTRDSSSPDPVLGTLIYPQKYWGLSARYEPSLGFYDSLDEEILDQQIAWMRHAGIDFALWQWRPDDGHNDAVIDLYRGRPVAISWAVQYESKMDMDPVSEWRDIDFTEAVPDGAGEVRGDRFVRRMNELIDKGWAGSRDYFTVNNRPVVYLWAFTYWRNWAPYVDRVFADYRERGLEPPYFIGVIDGWATPETEPFGFQDAQGRIAAFNAPIMVNKDERMMADYYGNVRAAWQRWKDAAESIGSILIPTVTAGFDYTAVIAVSAVLPREGGDTLRRHYELAGELANEDTPLVLNKSWNDFPEGDSVEPAKEYGTLYIDILRSIAEPRIPLLPPVTYLYVVDGNSLSPAEQVMVQGLQGILAQQAGGEDIWFATNHRYDRWRDDLEREYGVELDFSLQDDPWALVNRFKQQLSGYILFTLDEDSENVATSLAGVFQALPVEESLESRVQEHGLTLALDVRGKDEQWVLEQYWPSLNHDLVFHQIEGIHCCLRDYAVATRGLMFYDGDSEFFREVLHSVNEGGIVFGWGRDDFTGEERFVLPATQAGLITVPSDWAQNLSILSTFDLGPLRQKTPSPELQAEGDVHYVTFVMSDGDNLQWLLSDFAFDERRYGSPLRGEFPMGWTVSPMMAELAPTVMKRLYGDASDGDFFIAGISGRGYFYPSQLPDLEAEADRTNNAMSLAGLDIAYITDTESGAFSPSILANYAVQPNIAGGFWLYYPDNAARGGRIVFSHGKPFVSVTHNLWQGLESPESIAAEINAAPRDPHISAGYSVVNVHAWSMDLSDVAATIAALDADVRVVTPSDLIRLVAQNVSPASVEGCPFSMTGALVLSSEAAPEVRDVAMACRDIYGERVQVTSGFNDHVEIQAAIESLPDGGRVMLSEGQFEGGQIVLKSGISLEGQGPSTVYRLADGANTSAILGQSPTGYAGLQNVAIRALTIDGNRAGQSSTSHGIHIANALDITIADVHVQDARDSAMLLEDTQRVQVRNNNIKYSGHGITVQDAIYGQNLVEGNVLYGISGNAIQVLAETKECVDNNFNDNIIREARNGFFIQGVGHTAGGNNYSGNRILFVEEAAFHIGEWGGGSSMTGNYVNDA